MKSGIWSGQFIRQLEGTCNAFVRRNGPDLHKSSWREGKARWDKGNIEEGAQGCIGSSHSDFPMPDPEKLPTPILHVERIRDLQGWKRLEPEWNALLRESAADAVFLCWEWLDTWLEVYGDGGEWVILTARNQKGQLLGVAPMMLDRGAGLVGRWMRRVILVGQKADTASEYLDWVLRRGNEAEVVMAFCDYMLSKQCVPWDLLCFGAMRGDSASIPLLKEQFALRGQTLEVKVTSTAPFFTLPATWSCFLESRRAKFRQRLNKFQRDHAVAIRLVNRDMSVEQGMAKIRELNEHRWGEKRRSFLSKRYVQFHDRIAQKLHAQGHLLLIFLEADGLIIAGRYDFVYGGKAWSFQGGWLPEWEKESAGKLMLTEIMRWCIENGLKEYDFLGGVASYKTDWTEEERQIVDVQAFNPGSWRGKSYHLIKKLARKAASLRR